MFYFLKKDFIDYFPGVIMILGASFEFEKTHNSEVVVRESDNEQIPAVSENYYIK